jgi:hypothetical protein
MERRTPLRAMSDRRRQQLAEQGNPRSYSTLTNGAVGRGSAPRLAAPDSITVAAVVARDFGRCARCGQPVTGERGIDFSLHHRRPRAMGGSSRPDTNQPHNLVLLHGSGVSLCHGLVEQHRAEAYANGWLLRQGQDPSVVPVNHAAHGGWVLLTPDGGFSTYSPNQTTTEVPA